MSSQRHLEHYKGFHIVAALFRGEFQAKAKHKFLGELRVKKCTNLDDAIIKTKNIIDKYLSGNAEIINEKIITAHKEWMLKKGYDYKGVSKKTRYHRTNNCYSCKNAVDNSQDLECGACNWIVCSYCGSCGCGYVGFKSA